VRVTAALPALSLNYLPLAVGVEHGIFLKHGLEVEYPIIRSSTAVAATISGEADYLYSGDSGVFAAAQGAPLKLFLCNSRFQVHRLMAAPTIRQWSDFRGRVIGTTDVRSTTTVIAETMLERHGLQREDVTFLPTGSTENNLTTLLARQVGAAVLSPPAYVVAAEQGFQILGKSEDYIPLPPNCTVANERKLRERPEEVKSLIRATFESLDFIRQNKTGTIEAMVKILRVEPALTDRLYGDLVPVFEANGRMTPEQIAWQLDEARSETGADVQPAKVYDWTLLDQVVAERGGR
jgi:ABC-type nitrate/sulfonate/bicarbonate transport system substrate-binding protein